MACPSETLLSSLPVPLSSRHLDITAVLGDKVLTLCDVSWCHARLVANSKEERKCSLLKHVKKQDPKGPKQLLTAATPLTEPQVWTLMSQGPQFLHL